MSLTTSLSERKRVLLALGYYSVAIHRGITRFAHDAGWILDEGFVRDRTLTPGWDGAGVIAGLGVLPELDASVLSLQVPRVNIGYEQFPGIISVAADSEAIGRMAAEHFIKRGFRNFAFYVFSGLKGETQRLHGFEQVIKAARLQLSLIDPKSDPAGRANRFTYIARRLEELPKPVAVFAEFDDRAVEVLDAAIYHGLRVPEQIAVLGVNNDELRCPFAPVPLSSIDNDEERVGYEAARILAKRMAGEPVPDGPVLIPPKMVVTRQSTNILAIPHEDVAMALRLIWEHYREPIDANHIASAVPLSYPQLHTQFVRHVGHSMAREIMVRRLEHARKLLVETDTKIAEIARQSGFGSADRLGRVFCRELKITPSEYRQKHALADAPQHVSP